MLLQAYDFLELSRRYQCTIQVGGSDQWGNMISGIDLIRRVDGQQAFVLTVPLITRSDGLKFGKTVDGAIWLDPDMTSPYRFYQFWLNSADEDVVPFLGYFTFLDSSDIADAATELRDRPGERGAQRLLAREVTRLAHGQRALSSAERITAALFGGAVADLKREDLEQLQLDGMDSTSVENEEELLTALVRAGLAKSRGAGRKLIDGKGVQINGELVELRSQALRLERALFGRYHLLRRGKKSWHMFFHE
jgi:tyrosyl-tRNA synthetase